MRCVIKPFVFTKKCSVPIYRGWGGRRRNILSPTGQKPPFSGLLIIIWLMYIPVGAQVLALLDLSPTAHVINHAVIDRLGNKVGISRAMKAWLVFYPSDSVLGPKLFCVTFVFSIFQHALSFNCFTSTPQSQLISVSWQIALKLIM